VKHKLDEDSLVNPATGEPWPAWAGDTPQDTDPDCTCGRPWTDEGCGATWLDDLRGSIGMAWVSLSYWVRPYSPLLDRRCLRWRRPRCRWTGGRG
jgi:hypothetical protein